MSSQSEEPNTAPGDDFTRRRQAQIAQEKKAESHRSAEEQAAKRREISGRIEESLDRLRAVAQRIKDAARIEAMNFLDKRRDRFFPELDRFRKEPGALLLLQGPESLHVRSDETSRRYPMLVEFSKYFSDAGEEDAEAQGKQNGLKDWFKKEYAGQAVRIERDSSRHAFVSFGTSLRVVK